MVLKATTVVLLGLMAFSSTGCVAVLAGTAGALIIDEGFNENDGKFDPLENTQVGRSIYN